MVESGRDLPRARRNGWIAVTGLTLLAGVLRVPTLGLQSYEFDEAATLKVVDGSFGHALHKIAVSESTPPVYYVLAWLWRHIFGLQEIGFRLLPAVAGVLLVPAVFAVGRALASVRVGVVAAAIVATSPYLVFYSQEARAYSLYTLLSLVGLLCCVRVIRQPSAAAFALWAGVSIAAVATHYFALFPLVGQVVAFLVYGAPRRRTALWCAVVAAPTIALLVLARHQANIGHVDWIGASSLSQRIRVTVETFALGATFKGSLSHSVLLACGLAAIVIGAAIVVAVFFIFRRAEVAERWSAGLVGLVTVVTVAIPLVGALGPADYFIHKNLIPVLPQCAIVLAVGLGCRRAGRVGVWAAAVVAAAGVGLTVLSFAVPAMRRPNVRQVSDELGTPSHARVLVFVPRWELVLEHYQHNVQSLPAVGRRVSEIDVFTSSDDLPAGAVPGAFHATGTEHGDTFNLYRFRSNVPVVVRPRDVAQQLFSESGLQPIADYQPAAAAGP